MNARHETEALLRISAKAKRVSLHDDKLQLLHSGAPATLLPWLRERTDQWFLAHVVWQDGTATWVGCVGYEHQTGLLRMANTVQADD